MIAPDYPGTKAAVANALGYEPELDPDYVPTISFELGDGLRALDATDIRPDERLATEAQLLDCYRWCAKRFPLVIRDPYNKRCRAIEAIRAGHSAQPGEYLTASSPHYPYSILVAAPWPIPSRFRLASLLAHEALHQALYNRERQGPVARVGSLAYSPWKAQLRPGRLVWHAFWTFTGQFIFLTESVAIEGEAILSADPSILDFLAEMEARIECCAESLAAFDILPSAEAGRIQPALTAMRSAGESLARLSGYEGQRSRWAAAVQRQVESWGSRQARAAKILGQGEFSRVPAMTLESTSEASADRD